MSYCVNCGVELDKGADRCPLCDTQVINPRTGEVPEKKAYPDNRAIPVSGRKRYTAFIISMVMLIPCFVLFVLDLIIIDSFWPLCVIASCILFWICFIFPLLWKKVMVYPLIFLDCVAICVFTFLIHSRTDGMGWFSHVALPITVMLGVTACIMVRIVRRCRRNVQVVIAVLAAVIPVSFFTDTVVNLYLEETLKVFASPIIAACCIPLIVFFVFVARNKHFRSFVERRFFI